jgi:hypothetical protein
MTDGKFYAACVGGLTLIMFVGGMMVPSDPQRAAIAMAATAKRDADEKEYQAQRAAEWTRCVENSANCLAGGEPEHERAVMRDQLLRDAYSRR